MWLLKNMLKKQLILDETCYFSVLLNFVMRKNASGTSNRQHIMI